MKRNYTKKNRKDNYMKIVKVKGLLVILNQSYEVNVNDLE